eukprot:scaffold26153_cov34-Prasinocladus_malaysianus.AAC.1
MAGQFSYMALRPCGRVPLDHDLYRTTRVQLENGISQITSTSKGHNNGRTGTFDLDLKFESATGGAGIRKRRGIRTTSSSSSIDIYIDHALEEVRRTINSRRTC